VLNVDIGKLPARRYGVIAALDEFWLGAFKMKTV
jgi:hypothetical protein